MGNNRRRVVIIGAGFGGLFAARMLARHAIDVLLIDRNNYHTFTPLLYQVATCGLETSEIAYPVRSIFRKNDNVRFMLGNVQEIDYDAKFVHVRTNGVVREEAYDYLIVAAGSVTNYFGNSSLEQFSFEIKSLQTSLVLRNHILKLFEKAAWTEDDDDRQAMLTLVVVGGGPTGLETAGALYELYSYVLRNEFHVATPMRPRVILVEATDTLLRPYPESLQQSALKQLRSLGVDVRLGKMVEQVGKDFVQLKNGEIIQTRTLVWAAGVKASPLAEMLGVDLAQGGRVPVQKTTEVVGRDSIYAIGDISYLIDPKSDEPYPQLIPVAQQQGKLAAKNIISQIKGQPQKTFAYRDKGVMATIGRSRAVAWPFYTVKLTGFAAWFTWLMLHLVWLLGFRNRLNVMVNWIWNYITYDRSVRVILDNPVADEINPQQEELQAAKQLTEPAAD